MLVPGARAAAARTCAGVTREVPRTSTRATANRGGATAADIVALMDLTRERVQHQFGIALEPEIRIIGE